VDINKRNRAGMTALHYAGMFGQTRTAKFLLRVGGDKFVKDDEGRTAGRLAMDL
jgi:ankyrin repeat protein